VTGQQGANPVLMPGKGTQRREMSPVSSCPLVLLLLLSINISHANLRCPCSRRERKRQGKDCLHTPSEARSNLRRRLFIQELKQAQEFKIGAKFNLKEIKTNLAKVSVKDKAFSRQFAACS